MSLWEHPYSVLIGAPISSRCPPFLRPLMLGMISCRVGNRKGGCNKLEVSACLGRSEGCQHGALARDILQQRPTRTKLGRILKCRQDGVAPRVSSDSPAPDHES